MRIDNKTPMQVDAPVAPTVIAPSTKRKRGRPRKNEVLQTSERKTVHILDILDSSGSMSGSKYNAAREGLISKLQLLANDTTVDYTYSLFEFGDQQRKGAYRYQRVSNTEAIAVANTLRCLNTGTALTDSIITVLTDVKTLFDPTVKTLVNILTDGQECSSAERNPKVAAVLIKETEEQYGATITFVATQRDVEYAIALYDVNSTNTLVHDNTSASILRSSKMSAEATVMYSKSVASNQNVSSNFYSSVK